MEKKMSDAAMQLEDERRHVDQYKDQVKLCSNNWSLFVGALQADKANNKSKALRRQVEEVEEEISRERTKSRKLQRELDDLTEAIDTLTRDNQQLRSRTRYVFNSSR
jgi:myosin protein heavy chain